MTRRGDGPDTPPHTGLAGRMQLRLGRTAQAVASRLRRPVSLGVRLMALNERGEIMLVRHTYLPGLSLPGGAVDPGETCRAAAMREAREEANLEFAEPPELFHVYFNHSLAARDHVVLYVAKGAWQTAPTRPTAEIVSAGFHAVETLPDAATPATRARIAEVLNRAPISDIW